MSAESQWSKDNRKLSPHLTWRIKLMKDDLLKQWLDFAKDVEPSCAAGTDWLQVLRRKTEEYLSSPVKAEEYKHDCNCPSYGHFSNCHNANINCSDREKEIEDLANFIEGNFVKSGRGTVFQIGEVTARGIAELILDEYPSIRPQQKESEVQELKNEIKQLEITSADQVEIITHQEGLINALRSTPPQKKGKELDRNSIIKFIDDNLINDLDLKQRVQLGLRLEDFIKSTFTAPSGLEHLTENTMQGICGHLRMMSTKSNYELQDIKTLVNMCQVFRAPSEISEEKLTKIMVDKANEIAMLDQYKITVKSRQAGQTYFYFNQIAKAIKAELGRKV